VSEVLVFFFFQAEDGIRDRNVTGVQTCALPILAAFVIGIIALLASVTGFAIIPGIVGLVVAIIALVRNRKKPKDARRTWMSVLGLVFSIIGILASVLIFGALLAVFTDPAVQSCLDSAVTTEELQSCLESSL